MQKWGLTSLEHGVCMQNRGSTGCVHAEVSLELHSELGVCMQKWGSTGCVHAEVGFNSFELGVCMQR